VNLRCCLEYVLCVVVVGALLAGSFIVYLLWFQPAFNFPKPSSFLGD